MVIAATEGEAVGKPVAFDLCAGHPALDFVNSLDHRFSNSGCVEGLQSYDDLLRFTRQAQLLDSAQTAQVGRTVTRAAGMRALRAARALREALAATFYAIVDGQPPPSGDLKTLDRYFQITDRHRELRWQQGSGERFELAWPWRCDAGDTELPVWAVAHAARDLLLSPDIRRVRACEAETCRWLFLDTSKNHSRRWCKMDVCGNRMKARRYQARRSA